MMCIYWFVTFGSFCAKWPTLVSVIFLSCIDVKQQNDRKWCEKYLHGKISFVPELEPWMHNMVWAKCENSVDIIF